MVVSMKLLNEGDCVEVTCSKSGYTGLGELVGIAYGTHWLVKIPPEAGRNSLITVNAVHITKISDAISREVKKDKKKKQPKYDPADAHDETEERLSKKRKGR
jgi:proline racemase